MTQDRQRTIDPCALYSRHLAQDMSDAKTCREPIDRQLLPTEPFLKWAGGKQWLLKNYMSVFPARFDKYYEPFLGGGSVFFKIAPRAGVIGDLNESLIETYECVRDDWKLIVDILTEYHSLHNTEFYYNLRQKKFEDRFLRAAQFLYLNRTCWNGLYRVNLQGEFNVPIGTKTTVIMEKDDFAAASLLLQQVEIKHGDFEENLRSAGSNDFIFVDPPYNHSKSDKFVKYNNQVFSWIDQTRLRDLLLDKREKGSRVVITHLADELVYDLYKDARRITPVSRRDTLAAKPSKRGRYKEVLIEL